jgi:hypothetical protein
MEVLMNTNAFRVSGLAFVAFAAGLVGCGGKGSADQSYCQSLCDWAVECAAASRDIDEAAMMQSCLAATSSASGSCAEYDDGNMSKADELILADCNADIATKQAEGDCGAFTGTVAEAELSTPPATCNGLDGAQDAFDAAQSSVLEGSAEMCVRVADTFCSKMSECIDITPGFEADAVDSVPYDACMAALDGQVSDCISSDTYAPDPTNTQRAAADECLASFDDVTCDDVFSGQMPAVCAGAFVDPTDYAGTIYDIAQTYATGR